jgi:hypothetical protein
MTINIPDFIATIGPDAADMLLELLEIGEMRMVADAEAADPEDVDYDIARLRLGCAMNDWGHAQLTLALLDTHGFLEHGGCRDCFRLSELGIEALEFMRGVDGDGVEAEIVVDGKGNERLN